jgi:hypothetical protein
MPVAWAAARHAHENGSRFISRAMAAAMQVAILGFLNFKRFLSP